MAPAPKTLLISILSLGRAENVLSQLGTIPAWLDAFEQRTGVRSHIVVRNNDPAADFSAVAARIREMEAAYAGIGCTLITDVPNGGFGAGHNGNVATMASDYVLILNDDIGFPHLEWLGDAIKLIETDPRTVCVGAEENPKHINPAFGNGLLPGAFHLLTIAYAEASVLLFDRAAFDMLGGFSADFRWAMCEDSDLSLRVQQQGWSIAHMSMPHQHWRSSTFNKLPSQVKSSILEHNRAALFANWRESLSSGRVGRYEVYDLWSDGLGDVFCALPHMLARLAPMSPARRANVVVNTSHPSLFGWLGLDGIRVTSQRDLAQLRVDLDGDGVASLRSTRDVNYSLPFNIHALLAGALGIDTAREADFAAFAAALRQLRLPDAAASLHAGSYCVVHLEFERDHPGRGLPPAMAAELLKICGGSFDRIVLVGRERRLSAAMLADSAAEIIDLQGRLSLSQLAALITRAGFFVGIDSFPSHVAQAGAVPSAVFFGAIHPLTRAWNEHLTWPLTADLDCIGCYHTHLECSVPFCMRRDEACSSQVQPATMQKLVQAMAAGQRFEWHRLSLRLQALQAQLIKLARYHPAPPERLFRTQIMPNEQISNMIYRITDQMGTMMRSHYHSSTVTQLAAQNADLQAELYAARVALDDAARSKRAPTHLRPQSENGTATRIVQLNTISLIPTRCTIALVDQWIEIDSREEDPQIALPPLQGPGGKVQLRLTCTSEPEDALQVYWTVNEDGFSAERVHTIPTSGGTQTVNLVFDTEDSQLLHIRIDPITGKGICRLRGTLGGMFSLLENPAPVAGTESSPPACIEAQPPTLPKPAQRPSHRSRRFAGTVAASPAQPG